MIMKVVNDKNLSVEQLIMALAEREQVLYAMYQYSSITDNKELYNTKFFSESNVPSLERTFCLLLGSFRSDDTRQINRASVLFKGYKKIYDKLYETEMEWVRQLTEDVVEKELCLFIYYYIFTILSWTRSSSSV